ncbi:MAG: hypothetical protein LBS88_03730 [Tannerellaceae bacterium]|jgi:hypothetical protein|nr:hypothetical protein [Tannerellaceae bacterium]
MYIREILLKEEEKHRLTYIGSVADWAGVIKMTERSFASSKSSFADNKRLLLDIFYSSVLGYEKFIREEKASNINLKKHHFRKTEAYIAALQKNMKAALDEELKTPKGISFAWHFTDSLYENVYRSFCDCVLPLATPLDTDEFFFGKAKEMYPLTMKQVTEQLESDDISFWEICARYMQGLSRMVASYMLQRNDDYGFSDLIKDQTWTDVYRLMRNRLVDRMGNIPTFESGGDFRNYLIKACKLTASSLQRQYMQKDNYYIEDFPMNTSYEEEDNNDDDGTLLPGEACENDEQEDEISELDINIANPYEVASAVSIVLMNSRHPLYKSLTQGIEDKVGILIDKAVNDMSYNDIISEKYGEESLSEEDFRKAVVKARKDYERVRKTLCDRMRELVNKKTQSTVTNPAPLT